MTTILATYSDTINNVSFVVAKVAKGYSVALRDDDADEYAGIVTIFKSEEAAHANAKANAAKSAH